MQVIKKISSPSQDELIKQFLTRLQTTYSLPGDPNHDVYIIGISGGADSSALAILMHVLFPHITFQMVFTDTKAEPKETYESIDRLERFIGKPILKLVPEKGLFELIEHYNGFLPSGQQRWCTRELKLTHFKTWMKQYKGKNKFMFVGIRADENERVAFTIDECETEMPFVDLNLRREDIFELLSMTIGIPLFYQYRTRSGCSVCMFQRRSEVIGLMQYQPIEFIRGKSYEKLNETDLRAHIPAVALWKETGIAENWQSLPVPSNDVAIHGKVPRNSSMNLFGSRGIFVAGEFFMDAFGGEELCWHQRLISFSPSLHGLKRQIDDRYHHLLATSEVFDMSNEDVRKNARFVIWYIELEEGQFHPEVSTGSYTWKSGESYAMIEHVVSHVKRALNAKRLIDQANCVVQEDTVEEEWRNSAQVAIEKIGQPTGSVLLSQWYSPNVRINEMTDEEMIKSIPCPMCSI